MKAYCETKLLVMTILRAICFGTTYTNTQNDTIFRNFFQVFWKIVIFWVFQLQGPGNLLQGLIIGHCTVSSNNGLVFNIFMSRILEFFDKICNFFKVSYSFRQIFDICPFSSVRRPTDWKNLMHGRWL